MDIVGTFNGRVGAHVAFPKRDLAKQKCLKVAREAEEERLEEAYSTLFDVKLSGDSRRKARFVADGHLVEAPASVTYMQPIK